MRPRSEADHLFPPNTEVKKAWNYTSTPQYVFMAWYLVKHVTTLHLPCNTVWHFFLSYLLTYYPIKTPNVPSTKSHALFPLLWSRQRISPCPRHFETFRNKSPFCGEWLLAQPPSWRTTPCRLFATAYPIYSQLPSVSGGLPSIRNLRTRHAVVTRYPPNMDGASYWSNMCCDLPIAGSFHHITGMSNSMSDIRSSWGRPTGY
jgi:hypothetical protein